MICFWNLVLVLRLIKQGSHLLDGPNNTFYSVMYCNICTESAVVNPRVCKLMLFLGPQRPETYFSFHFCLYVCSIAWALWKTFLDVYASWQKLTFYVALDSQEITLLFWIPFLFIIVAIRRPSWNTLAVAMQSISLKALQKMLFSPVFSISWGMLNSWSAVVAPLKP